MNPNHPAGIQPQSSALLRRQPSIKYEDVELLDYDSDDLSGEDLADSIEQDGGGPRKRQRPMSVSYVSLLQWVSQEGSEALNSCTDSRIYPVGI